MLSWSVLKGRQNFGSKIGYESKKIAPGSENKHGDATIYFYPLKQTGQNRGFVNADRALGQATALENTPRKNV